MSGLKVELDRSFTDTDVDHIICCHHDISLCGIEGLEADDDADDTDVGCVVCSDLAWVPFCPKGLECPE